MGRTSSWRWYGLSLLASLLLGQAAIACPPFPIPPRLPGEQDEDFKRRVSSSIAAQRDEERRSHQLMLFDTAEKVYFARVLETALLPNNAGFRVSVAPVRSLRGDLPTNPASYHRHISCGGGTPAGERGDIAIVFEGVRLNGRGEALNLGLLAHEARDPRLIRELFDWGASEARVSQAAAASAFQFVDLTDDFARFEADSRDLQGEARVAAFKQHFEPLIPGFYYRTKIGPYDYGELILKALQSYPEQRAGIEQVSHRFAAMAAPAQARFEASFGPMGQLPPIVLLHSLGEMDGGVRTLKSTGRTLIFGADLVAKMHLAHGVEPFVHHELFHVFHKRSFEGCDAVWCDLWSEGLAVYVAEQLNPGATDAQLLLVEPVPLRAAVDANRQAALEQVLARLDSTDSSGLFGGSSTSEVLPSRAGYYIGYLVAAELGKTRSLSELAALGPAEVRPLIGQALTTLAARPKEQDQ